MKTKLTIEEKNYLRDLLNHEVEDPTKRENNLLIYYIQEKLELFPAKELNKCSKCNSIYFNTRRKRKGGIYLDHVYCEQCENRFLEVPVKKGNHVVLVARNGKYTELWNDTFNFNYLIKLYKMPKKAKEK